MAGTGMPASRRRWVVLIAAISSILLLLTAWSTKSGGASIPSFTSKSKHSGASKYVKPHNITIIGLVFFGRKSTVEILRCYLERNLAVNGGWLDEIHWVQNTEKEDDLAYLDEILASSPEYYKKIELANDPTGLQNYEGIWTHLERGKLYIKIDDDVTWFEDTTIPSLVTLKLAHPEYFMVSANMINNPLMGWVHYHMGAVHPYLPEAEFSAPAHDAVEPSSYSWRYDDYPAWAGPDDYTFPLEGEPPYSGHRWLRLMTNSTALAIDRTPIAKTEYHTWGNGLKSWAIASQHHYSLLENLATDRLDRYKFGNPWIVNYDRLSINFVALMADEVLDNLPMDDVDEAWLTQILPRRLGKSIAVDGEALAAHFAFWFQPHVQETDLLKRYKSYAVENVCMP